MLEHPHLLMPALTRGAELVIRGENEGPPLGLARWAAPRFWFDAGLVEVCEYDDAPLIFQARRIWSLTRCFRVWDAAEVEVGLLRPRSLQSPTGREIAWRIVEGNRVTYHLLDGPILAQETRIGPLRRLAFGTELAAGNPFLRMLVVGAVLLL